jgi:hypothetical protein
LRYHIFLGLYVRFGRLRKDLNRAVGAVVGRRHHKLAPLLEKVGQVTNSAVS